MQYFLTSVVIWAFSTGVFIILFDNFTFAATESADRITSSLYLYNGNVDPHSDLSLIPNIVNVTTSWIAEYGYVGVFTAALVENLFPPIPSELIFPLAGITAFTKDLGFMEGVIGMSLAGASGSTVGAIVIYYISRRIGRAAILKLGNRIGIGEKELEKSEKWFDKHGSTAVFFGRMAPGIRELISIPAGIEKMKLSTFIAFTFAGSFVWCTFLTTIGFFLGEVWSNLYEDYSFAFDLVAIIIIGSIIGAISYRLYKNKKKKTS
ncbi:DedA family protein [Candidatus Nitrosocosmicus hydrocola]|uniref:DedA family protein n=1 Tax=Candidatus Nitrosocosmicus hydrocola TaxID=1826872 RepID=UPI0011E5DC57|nr:DedA family protein [Candidatus Nitrosocosmicus hydrocola]